MDTEISERKREKKCAEVKNMWKKTCNDDEENKRRGKRRRKK